MHWFNIVYPQSVLRGCCVVSRSSISSLLSPLSSDIPLSCIASALCAGFKELLWFSSWILDKKAVFYSMNSLIINFSLQSSVELYRQVKIFLNNDMAIKVKIVQRVHWAVPCLPFRTFTSCIYIKGADRNNYKRRAKLDDTFSLSNDE